MIFSWNEVSKVPGQDSKTLPGSRNLKKWIERTHDANATNDEKMHKGGEKSPFRQSYARYGAIVPREGWAKNNKKGDYFVNIWA